MRFYLAIVLLLKFGVVLANDTRNRTKRQINSIPLVFPYGAIYKLLIGFASPVATKDQINLLFGVNFQYQYAQFTNISQLSQYYFIKKVSRELRSDADISETGDPRDVEGREDKRLIFYRSIADLMTAKGMNGPACVLRAICESAQFPVEEEGLVGEILHVLLSPDYGATLFDDEDPDQTEIVPYIDAAVAGRQMFSCPDVYGGCPAGEGLMELISSLRDD